MREDGVTYLAAVPGALRRPLANPFSPPWDLVLSFHVAPADIAIHYWRKQESSLELSPMFLPPLVSPVNPRQALFLHQRSAEEAAVLASLPRFRMAGLTPPLATIWQTIADFTPSPPARSPIARGRAWPGIPPQKILAGVDFLVREGWVRRLVEPFSQGDLLRRRRRCSAIAVPPHGPDPVFLGPVQDLLWRLLTSRTMWPEEALFRTVRKRHPRCAPSRLEQSVQDLIGHRLAIRSELFAYPHVLYYPNPDVSFRLWKGQGYLYDGFRGEMLALRADATRLWNLLAAAGTSTLEELTRRSRDSGGCHPPPGESCVRNFLAAGLHHDLIRSHTSVSDIVRCRVIPGIPVRKVLALDFSPHLYHFWRALKAGRQPAELCAAFAAQPRLSRERLESMVIYFLQRLEAAGFVRLSLASRREKGGCHGPPPPPPVQGPNTTGPLFRRIN